MAERWREHCYRKLYHLSHEQYLDEPGHVIDWSIELAKLEADMEDAAIRRARDAR